jgi:hypothetical protein
MWLPISSMIHKTGGFLSAAIDTQYVRDMTNELGVSISNHVLTSPDVVNAAKVFVAEVLRVRFGQQM